MAKFIIILQRIFTLYLYYVIIACLLGCVPNINPDYPIFDFIFTFAGFYLVPPIYGISFSPAIVMIVTALICQGLYKIYEKFYKPKEPEVIIMSPKEFFDSFEKYNKSNDLKEKENKDDITKEENDDI